MHQLDRIAVRHRHVPKSHTAHDCAIVFDNDGARVCSRLFTERWASLVARGAGRSCVSYVDRVESGKRAPTAGLTFIAISGPGSAGQPDTHSWAEWQLDAPDRATYKLTRMGIK